MIRRILIAALFVPVSTVAQVPKLDETLQEQIVAGSFVLSGSALAKRDQTVVSYTIVNKTGINIYMATTSDGTSVGSCLDDIRLREAGLPVVPGPNSGAPSGRIPGVFVPASGRASGSFVVVGCTSPNPGFPTALLGITLMISRTNDWKTMFALPVEGEISIRQDTE